MVLITGRGTESGSAFMFGTGAGPIGRHWHTLLAHHFTWYKLDILPGPYTSNSLAFTELRRCPGG